MSVEATALVRSGHLEIRNRKAFTKQLRGLRDGVVRVRVERVRSSRSAQANNFYWGVIVELLSEHTGYTPDDLHDILKAKFLPKRLAVADSNGEIVGEFVIGGSTVKLDKIAFGEYCAAIRQWASDSLGVIIPAPETGRLFVKGTK
ncbi:MAG TPA: hypothetical protein VNJ04_11950 [Gemmatimonadaceae bacterium]|nr:hypothetical protein [Gemmatimonadaceae bacterium]